MLSPVTVSASVGQAAIHQLPSVISKPKIFMTTPGQVLVNGPTGATLTNGTHLEIKREDGEGRTQLHLAFQIYRSRGEKG